MVVIAENGVHERKRPILVWVISAFYTYAFISWLWGSIPLIKGDLPISTNPDDGRFILIVGFFTTGLWFIASIFLIFLRKVAVTLFVAGFLIGFGYTWFTIPDWRSFLTLPPAILIGVFIGDLVRVSVCVYAWHLNRTGVLT
jgi:hypothetical protein